MFGVKELFSEIVWTQEAIPTALELRKFDLEWSIYLSWISDFVWSICRINGGGRLRYWARPPLEEHSDLLFTGKARFLLLVKWKQSGKVDFFRKKNLRKQFDEIFDSESIDGNFDSLAPFGGELWRFENLKFVRHLQPTQKFFWEIFLSQ